VAAKKPKLLCVDDDAHFLKLRRLFLEAFGFQVVTSTEPRQAMRLFRRTRFDAAVIDFQMPQMNGAELAKEFKQRRPEVPIAILSGMSDVPTDAPQYHDRFISKTEPGPQLVKQIQDLIATARARNAKPARVPVHKKLVAFSALALGFGVEAVSRRRGRKPNAPALNMKGMARA
jgi:DNA-binding NtrC family response regulator